jgi:hypothetical protein
MRNRSPASTVVNSRLKNMKSPQRTKILKPVIRFNSTDLKKEMYLFP